MERISRQTKQVAQPLSAVEYVGKNLGERLDSLHAVVASLEGEESYLNKTVGELAGDLRAIHETVAGIKGDVERLTERLARPQPRTAREGAPGLHEQRRVTLGGPGLAVRALARPAGCVTGEVCRQAGKQG